MNKKPIRQKRPKKISIRYLENAALYYLQRYASSEENLRRVLQRKVKRSCTFHKTDPEEFYSVIDKLVEKYAELGLVNDRAFAEAKTASLRRQGKSRQAIMAKLRAKGLGQEDTEQALALIDIHDQAELSAALILAKKKKLGCFRKKPAATPQEKKKDLAILARAGFSYDIACQALKYKNMEEELDLLDDL